MVGKTALNKEMKHLNGAYFRTISYHKNYMRNYKYTKETLDVALQGLQSKDVAERKKYTSFISNASRSELFGKTCDTLGVQSWFLLPENREKLINAIHQETEPKLLWEYLLIIKSVCDRYIDAPFYIKDFAKEPLCIEFKQRAYEVAKQYSNIQVQ